MGMVDEPVCSTTLDCCRRPMSPAQRSRRASSAAEQTSRPERRDCPFCRERLDRSKAAHDEKLFSNGLVHVLPDLSPLCPGHLLTVARRHVLSMAGLGSVALADVASTVSMLCTDLSPEFGDYFLFEHGTPPDGSSHGACLDHAHIHMLPMESSMFDRLIEALPWESISRFEDLHRYEQDGYAYLGIKGSHYVYPNPDTGSQWIRRQVCAFLRRDDWDWALTQSNSELSRTLEVGRRLLSASLGPFPRPPEPLHV
jgi:diadenosine tetraphosphate (Ap4A) HIT family hydrolase